MTSANSAAFLSDIAFAEEATAGTVETTPDVYDFMTDDPAINPVQTVIKLPTIQTREQRRSTAGDYHMEGNVPMFVDPEGALGFILECGIGASTSAQQGATSAYKHTWQPDDTLKTLTTWLKRGGNQQIKIPYTLVNTINFKQGLNEVLMMNVGIIGQKDQIADDFGDASYSTVTPFRSQDLTVSIAGSDAAQAAQVHNVDLTIDNGFNIQDCMVFGSRHYAAHVGGKRKVSGSFDMWFDSDVEYERFWGDAATPATDPETEITATTLQFNWDTGIEADTGYNYELDIAMDEVIYESTKVSIGGGRVKQTVDFFAEYDATATNEIEFYLVNTVVSY